jgi:hypothetical protein
VPISVILYGCENVDFVVSLSGESQTEFRAHVTYKDRVDIIWYWADVDYPKLKVVMADDLRRNILYLLEDGIPKIKLSKFILAPTYRSVDDSDFITNKVLTLLKNKCVEEALIKEKFRTD